MRANYFREMKHHHLMIAAGEVRLMDYQVKMIKGNKINGLICPTIRQSNNRTEYDYLITGWQSLQTFVENEPLSEEVLRVLVGDLCTLLDEMDRFLVDGDYLCLRPEYIYLEKKGDKLVKVRYCLFPFCEQSFAEQARELFKYIINEVDYQDQSAVTLAYDLFQAVQEEFVPSVLKEITQRAVLDSTKSIIKEDKIKIVEEAKSESMVSTEEILWIDKVPPKEKKKSSWGNRRDEGRKISAQPEILLPANEKRGIIGLIIKNRR